MEDNENGEINPINDEAPPVPMMTSQINNNINNINLNESNFNLFHNIPNDKMPINQINSIQLNSIKNNNQQNQFIYKYEQFL